MKLFDILKNQGLFSNELKSRIKNKQITLNGEIVKSDFELNVETKAIEAGDLVVDLIKLDRKFADQIKFFGLENLIDSNIESELTQILNQFIVVKISKKEVFLLKKKKDNA